MKDTNPPVEVPHSEKKRLETMTACIPEMEKAQELVKAKTDARKKFENRAKREPELRVMAARGFPQVFTDTLRHETTPADHIPVIKQIQSEWDALNREVEKAEAALADVEGRLREEVEHFHGIVQEARRAEMETAISDIADFLEDYCQTRKAAIDIARATTYVFHVGVNASKPLGRVLGSAKQLKDLIVIQKAA